MMVAWGISEELDQLKLTYHGLPDFLTAVVERELDRIPRHLSNEQRRQLWAIVYMPQARCCPAGAPMLIVRGCTLCENGTEKDILLQQRSP